MGTSDSIKRVRECKVQLKVTTSYVSEEWAQDRAPWRHSYWTYFRHPSMFLKWYMPGMDGDDILVSVSGEEAALSGCA